LNRNIPFPSDEVTSFLRESLQEKTKAFMPEVSDESVLYAIDRIDYPKAVYEVFYVAIRH
jgi:hypothetical protein